MMKLSLAVLAMAVFALAGAGCHHSMSSYPPIDDFSGGGSDNADASHGTAPLEPGATNVPRHAKDAAPDETAEPPDGTEPPDATEPPPDETPSTAPATRPSTPARPATGKAPLSKLYGTAVRGSHVVYVIDRSATTNKHWEDIRGEVVKSMGDLWQDQDFCVILMGDRKPTIGPAKGLTQAKKHAQEQASLMLLQTDASGKTDPVAALKMALATLDQADAKPGKVIYFVTDRAMLDKTLPQLLQVPNARKDLVVMTYLIGDGSADAKKVLEKLASDSGGRFTQVKPQAAD